MDNVLVCLMIITLVSNMTQATSGQCHEKCQPGFHSAGLCEGFPTFYYCKQCNENTFTAIENTRPHCERCHLCRAGEVEKEKCTLTSNTICQCKDGYYRPDSDSTCKACKQSTDFNNPAWSEKCQPCQWPECLKNPMCRKTCKVTSTYQPPTTNTSSPSSLSLSSSLSSSSSGSTSTAEREGTTPIMLQQGAGVPWRPLVVVVTGVVFPLLVMLFTRNLLRKADRRFCWRENKKYSVEAPQKNEQCKLQSSSPTSLTLNISEETPIMCSSQNTTRSDPLALMSFPLPALKQESQSEHWPAIVLYAIINVVPVRRWKEFLRLLSVADQQLERVELAAGFDLGFIEKQYQMLKLWSQHSSASLREVFSALHYMDLSGCAQMLQENLDKLQWKHKSKQILLSCMDLTDCELSEVVQDTKGGTSGI